MSADIAVYKLSIYLITNTIGGVVLDTPVKVLAVESRAYNWSTGQEQNLFGCLMNGVRVLAVLERDYGLDVSASCQKHVPDHPAPFNNPNKEAWTPRYKAHAYEPFMAALVVRANDELQQK